MTGARAIFLAPPLVLDTFIALVLAGIAVLATAFNPAADAGLAGPGSGGWMVW